jgi:hypothetical protein
MVDISASRREQQSAEGSRQHAAGRARGASTLLSRQRSRRRSSTLRTVIARMAKSIESGTADAQKDAISTQRRRATAGSRGGRRLSDCSSIVAWAVTELASSRPPHQKERTVTDSV